MIGDPSGKSRRAQSADAGTARAQPRVHHARSSRSFSTSTAAGNPARLVNNYDWTAPVSILDFLRDIGKHVTVNSMVAKDSVRSRMEDRRAGISFAEFSYMLLQGFDFYHLRKTFDCELQVGAHRSVGQHHGGHRALAQEAGRHRVGAGLPADHEGRRLEVRQDGDRHGLARPDAHLAVPLLPVLREHGRRGRDRAPQDADVPTEEEIAELEAAVRDKPQARIAQKALAHDMTTMVHGEGALDGATRASEILFGGTLDGVSERFSLTSSAKCRRRRSGKSDWTDPASFQPISSCTPGCARRRAGEAGSRGGRPVLEQRALHRCRTPGHVRGYAVRKISALAERTPRLCARHCRSVTPCAATNRKG